MVWIILILTAKVSAPISDLDPPDIFLTMTDGLIPLSAKLLSKGTFGKSISLKISYYKHSILL